MYLISIYYCSIIKLNKKTNGRNDSEIYQNISEIIRNQGYEVEEHPVTSQDGYILTLIRMYLKSSTQSKMNGTILLEHGLLDSADTWVLNLKNESLGFLLADQGYDVWFGNARGNKYSRKHRFYSPNQAEFWNFTIDQMIRYDLPATVNYIIRVTGSEKIIYVGFSQGSLIGFTSFSSYPEIQKHIKLFVALGPVAYLIDHHGFVSLLVRYEAYIEKILSLYNPGEFLPSSEFFRSYGRIICTYLPSICLQIISSIVGHNEINTNKTRLPMYIAHTPAGTSLSVMRHYSQLWKTGKLQRFDYGPQRNEQIYGQSNPPPYDLRNFSIPTALYYGGHDNLSTPECVEKLLNIINHTVVSRVFVPSYNHLDFLWGLDAVKVIYPSVLNIIRKN